MPPIAWWPIRSIRGGRSGSRTVPDHVYLPPASRRAARPPELDLSRAAHGIDKPRAQPLSRAPTSPPDLGGRRPRSAAAARGLATSLMRGAPAGNALIDPLLHASTWLARWRSWRCRSQSFCRFFAWASACFVSVQAHPALHPARSCQSAVRDGTEFAADLPVRRCRRATITGSYATSTQYNNHNARATMC